MSYSESDRLTRIGEKMSAENLQAAEKAKTMAVLMPGVEYHTLADPPVQEIGWKCAGVFMSTDEKPHICGRKFESFVDYINHHCSEVI